MKKLVQTSLDQTGVAILEDSNKTEKIIPLFSENPVKEAKTFTALTKNYELKHVFISNNLLDYKITDAIDDYREEHPNVLPEDLMNELVTGFPFVAGIEPNFLVQRYK